MFWTVWGNPGMLNGAVRRSPIGGGTIDTLADGQPSPFGMGLTGSAVVWANYDSGEIKLVAK